METRSTQDGASVAPGCPTPLEPAPGALLLDDYVVVRQLGRGGMGAVLLARSQATGRHFAVKRVLPERLSDPAARLAFLRELLTWSELPPHPHLAAFRFLRTTGGQILVFSEYAAGGSLQDRLGAGGLGSPAAVLRAAVESAWGLHTAHVFGVVHQDVKPGNILLTAEGAAKITDFGLARSAAAGGRPDSPRAATEPGSAAPARLLPGGPDSAPASMLVSWGGMTPAFCSPEQAEGGPVTFRTDIWSWGLTVLSLFAGRVFWESGTMAAEALAEIRAGSAAAVEPLPEPVAEVLARCFAERPENRWPDLAAAAAELAALYLRLTGRELTPPPWPRPTPGPAPAGERRLPDGSRWDDPGGWLARAEALQGSPGADHWPGLRPAHGTARGWAIADLAAFEMALDAYEVRLAAGEGAGRALEAARLCESKAQVHVAVGDLGGALALQTRAIELYGGPAAAPAPDSAAAELAEAHSRIGTIWLKSGNAGRALEAFTRSSETWDRLVASGRGPTARTQQARLRVNLAQALRLLGRVEAAEQRLREAERLLTALAGEGHSGCRDELAVALANLAELARGRGDWQGFVELQDEAIGEWRTLAETGRDDLRPKIAWARICRATALERLGRTDEAVAEFDSGTVEMEELAGRTAAPDIVYRLAMAHLNRAAAAARQGRPEEAGGLEDRAIAIMERLVHHEGRLDLAANLAVAYANRAFGLKILGDHRQAVAVGRRAIAIYERLLGQEFQPIQADRLARAWRFLGGSLEDLEDLPGALAAYERALELFRRLAEIGFAGEQSLGRERAVLARAVLLARAGRFEEVRDEAAAALAVLEQAHGDGGNAGLAEEIAGFRLRLPDPAEPGSPPPAPQA